VEKKKGLVLIERRQYFKTRTQAVAVYLKIIFTCRNREHPRKSYTKVTCNQVEMRIDNMTSTKPHNLIASSWFLAAKLRVYKSLVLV
jgi:hypothetical protein